MDTDEQKNTLNPDDSGDIDDVTIESYSDDGDAGSGVSPEEKIKKLRTALASCKKERDEYLDGWQRLKADFVNYKRREVEERKAFEEGAVAGFVEELIPVFEGFRMALAHEGDGADWRKGIEHIATLLSETLRKEGLEVLDGVGVPFDPNVHMSIGSVETDDAARYHTVAEVVQTGYRWKGKLLKSPMVRVYEPK